MTLRGFWLAAWATMGLLALVGVHAQAPSIQHLAVSANHRYLQYADGEPFFWLGDTAWLLFTRLDRSATLRYLDDRQTKGFTVIQVMVLHTAAAQAANGAHALKDSDPAQPIVTMGNDPNDSVAYDYWDHVDWVLREAGTRGMHVALVPAWGSVVKEGRLTAANVSAYATFLATRYRDLANVVWLVGGDIRGDEHPEVWRTMGRVLRAGAPAHLITFHPFGRTQSSTWFHDEAWLDFNMFQSGHQRYDQDTKSPKLYGEDNWRYVLDDVSRTPPKPTLDGEPSYESIPQGLHDGTQPYWSDTDARRFAYWSVFAGACGHTYGNNAIMQFHSPAHGRGAYAPRSTWVAALDDPGAGQMRHLKALMLSRPYFDRIHDATVVVDGFGDRYDRVLATRGRDYLFAYSHTGRSFTVRAGAITGAMYRGWWYDPRTGHARDLGLVRPDQRRFTPPGTPGTGNDWVLVLDDASREFPAPGQRRQD